MHHPTHMQQLLADLTRTRTRCRRHSIGGETREVDATVWQLTAPDADAVAIVVVSDGEPLPAELSDDDISATTPRAASVLRQAWRELVVAHNS